MSFVDPASDWYSVSVPVIIDVISYNIGPSYNGTWLYNGGEDNDHDEDFKCRWQIKSTDLNH